MYWLKVILYSMILVLTGCGGDSAPSNNQDGGGTGVVPPAIIPDSESIQTMDFSLLVESSLITKYKTLDISPYIFSKNSTHPRLAEVLSLNENCLVQEINTDNLTFTFSTKHYGECLFRYSVSIKNENESAIARVIVSPSSPGNTNTYWGSLPIGNELDAISKSTSLGDDLSFFLPTEPEIASELTAMVNPKFSESTIAYGNGVATLTEEGQFSFNAVATGVTLINYYILDDKNTPTTAYDDEIYVGQVWISVSGTTNAPPTAKDVSYDKVLLPDSVTEFDISNFPDIGSLISDVDADDELQLVDIHAEDVFVSLSAPYDVTNTSFKVQIPSSIDKGRHSTTVFYTVYDHNEGGIAQGRIEIFFGKAITDIFIVPAPAGEPYDIVNHISIPMYSTQKFEAIGQYDDGTTQIISSEARWNSSNSSIASIDSSGLAHALLEGDSVITATYTNSFGDILTSNSVTLNVFDPLYPITWGNDDYGGDSERVQRDLVNITEVFNNLYSFAALKADGTVVTWGDTDKGGSSSSVQSELTNVSTIFNTHKAYAALKADGTVVTWGDPERGGDSSSVASSLNSVTSISSTGGAFAALRNDGTVVAWGEPSRGGDTGSLTATDLSNVEKLYAYFNGSFFAAFKADGSVLTWGDPGKCGDSSSVDLSNVKSITSNVYACAFLKNDDTVITLGYDWAGGDSSGVDLTNVKEVFAANNSGFAALKNDGTVVSWGISDSEIASSLTSVVTITSTSTAFAALKTDGTVVTWGESDTGGDSTDVDLTNVKEVIPNNSAFAALKFDGTVVAWGNPNVGGDTTGMDLTNVERIVAAPFGRAFSAIKTDKTVVTWGSSRDGGDSSSVESDLFGVERLFATDYAFCALKY